MITEFDTWKSLDGRKTVINKLEDTHLANIIRWVTIYNNIYPQELLGVLHNVAAKRGLTPAFLAAAEIPHKNAEGHWMLNFERVG